jgi:hypothetical protein
VSLFYIWADCMLVVGCICAFLELQMGTLEMFCPTVILAVPIALLLCCVHIWCHMSSFGKCMRASIRNGIIRPIVHCFGVFICVLIDRVEGTLFAIRVYTISTCCNYIVTHDMLACKFRNQQKVHHVGSLTQQYIVSHNSHMQIVADA